MPRIFINLKAGCLQVNLMSISAQINQLKYTILYYICVCIYIYVYIYGYVYVYVYVEVYICMYINTMLNK